MNGFIKKMFANGESDTVSHKRVVSIISVAVLVILAFMSAFGLSASSEYIYVFAGLTGCESFFTTLEKIKSGISTIGKAKAKNIDVDED